METIRGRKLFAEIRYIKFIWYHVLGTIIGTIPVECVEDAILMLKERNEEREQKKKEEENQKIQEENRKAKMERERILELLENILTILQNK